MRESGYDASRAYRRAQESDRLIDLSGDIAPPRAAGQRRTVEELLHENDSRLGELELAKMREAGQLVDLRDVLREGTYGGDEYGTPRVYYEDEQTLPDLQDLFTVLPTTLANGSPNLENEIVKRAIEAVESNQPLDLSQIGAMKDLLAKYAGAIAALRASPDKQGQDYSAAPERAKARLVESAGSTDLVDLWAADPDDDRLSEAELSKMREAGEMLDLERAA